MMHVAFDCVRVCGGITCRAPCRPPCAMRVDVIDSAAACTISCQPYTVGDELSVLAKEATMDFLKHVGVADAPDTSYVALEILNGGRYYYMPSAFAEVTGRECALSQLRAKRSLGEDGNWQVRVWEKSGASLASGHVLIGDTVATGTTLAGVLRHVLDDFEAAGAWQNITIFTIVGADVSKVLAEVDEKLTAHDRELRVVHANAVFPLDDNGTDMGFHYDRETANFTEKAKSVFRERLGDYDAHMKCAVWDWGDRFREIPNHLKEIHEYYSSTDPKAPAWLLEGIEASLAKATAETTTADSEEK